MFRLEIAPVTFGQQIIALENILFQRYYFSIIVMMAMFMSVIVFMVMMVIVMMMLSASASSTHKRLSFYFITIDLSRSSRPFVIFTKYEPQLGQGENKLLTGKTVSQSLHCPSPSI